MQNYLSLRQRTVLFAIEIQVRDPAV